MSALDHPSLLEQLIIAGELALQMRSSRSPETIEALIAAVGVEFEKPVDGPRVIDLDTIIFATALSGAGMAMWNHKRSEAAKYLRVIGVLMPDIRAALGEAIEIRKRPTP
jgi:hypothetical protein